MPEAADLVAYLLPPAVEKLAARLAGFDYIEEKYLALGALAEKKVVSPDAPEDLEERAALGWEGGRHLQQQQRQAAAAAAAAALPLPLAWTGALGSEL